ncbi:MAG: polysaccharide biosynthesis protein [Tannerellaceae bacterium]|nr:polysaccharide biosynthesis protein [Tannerellaceae bacterium]
MKTFADYLSHIKYLNRWIIFLIDLALSFSCTGLTLLFMQPLIAAGIPYTTVAKFMLFSAAGSAVAIFWTQTYRTVIRHAGFVEVGRIAMAALVKAGLIFAGMFFAAGVRNTGLLTTEAVADLFFTFLALVLVRAGLIAAYNYFIGTFAGRADKAGILLFDSGVNPLSSTASILGRIGQEYKIMGYVKFGRNGHGRIGEYPVYWIETAEDFDRLIRRRRVAAVLFPNQSSVREEENRLIRYCEKKRIRMMIAPPVVEIVNGRAKSLSIPEVRIEDLLERREIEINTEAITHSLSGKSVMITGAAGSIGSELCRQLCSVGVSDLILFDCAETPMHNLRLELESEFPAVALHPIMGDIRNKSRVESAFKRFSPQTVFHAAAYKHVPLMEENPCEAVGTNVGGTMIVADAAVRFGAEKFIMISTDKAVNPTNVMGASKRLAEIYVQSLDTAKGSAGSPRFITTRFGNVLGSNGSVIPRFREQLIKGGPLTVTHPEIVRFFMTIPEACRLVLEAACMGEGNEIFVFDMGSPVKIDRLARRMIELAGLEPDRDILIEYTGLRPGEKLYEELLADSETSLPTSNRKIFRAKVREYNYATILPELQSLCASAEAVRIIETVRKMKELAPEFRSRQSEFEVLDDLSA